MEFRRVLFRSQLLPGDPRRDPAADRDGGHGAPCDPQRGRRTAPGAARRQDRGRFRYRAAAVHVAVRAAHQGVMRVLRSRVGVAGMMVIVLAIGSAALWTKAIHWRPNPAPYPLQGLHVSAARSENPCNIAAARAADFAYVPAPNRPGAAP